MSPKELPESTLKRAAKVAACSPKLERRHGRNHLEQGAWGVCAVARCGSHICVYTYKILIERDMEAMEVCFFSRLDVLYT